MTDTTIHTSTVIAAGQVGLNLTDREDKWLKQFNDNYYGRSPEARELRDKSKANYKGNVYIPWAVIERMTYQQDPTANFVKIQNAQGGFVHSDIVEIHSIVDGKETIIQSIAHFVRIGLHYLGRYFEETYPVQDQSYNAPKVFDQNQVNKAMQRGLAKVASRATGLALSLYEGYDLQFEEYDTPVTADALVAKKKPITEKTKEALEELKNAPAIDIDAELTKLEETVPPVAPKATRRTTVKKAEPVAPVVEETEPEDEEPKPTLSPAFIDAISKIIVMLKNDDIEAKVTSALRSFNKSFLTSYGFTLTREESVEELAKKLAMITDPTKFLASLERMCR